MKKLLLSLALLASIFVTKPAKAYYETDEEVNQIVVDKTIKGLDKADWKDNYPSNEIIFKPGDQFEFQIVVKNTGNRNLTQIQVKDILPTSLSYIFGRTGASIDNLNIGWTIPEIKPSENQTTVIRVKVIDNISVSLKEWVNFVEAKAESGAYDSDTSAFWTAEGKVVMGPVRKLPDTGAENSLLIGSLASSSLIAAAFVLRKYSRGY